MCGIAGLWRLSGADPTDVRAIRLMSSMLVHRGPDDFGFLLADSGHGHTVDGQDPSADFVPDLLLASRRLSILDLSPAGRQPITNEANDIFVVFNGAIHNYIELRRELEGFGHVFRSHTDTEVIVHAYEQWGPDCARRFNGMWAYAIWDKPRGRLVLSRDRFGVKPLLIARHRGALYFASEAKAIIAAGVPAVPNPNFVRQFIAYSVPIMGDETAFEGITQLPAGHNLIVTASGEHQSRYWSYADRSESYDFKHPTETFRDLFDDAVRLRLRSDVPIAVLLSGGLDSSSIAVRAAKHLDVGQLQAFTAVFPGHPVDEERHARQVAEQAGLDLNIVEYHEDDLLADLAAATWALDLPPAMTQTIGRWRLLETVSKTARIVLDGQGGDEILGGYPYRYLKHYARSERASLRPWNLYPKLGRMLAANAEVKRYRARSRASPPFRFNPEIMLSADFPPERPVAGSPGPVPGFATPSDLLTQLWRDHSFLIIPHVVHFADAISMAHSVESRPPFLDHRLVEFMYGLPVDQMIRGTETKYVLRQALANDLPPAIVNRRDKMGMRPPTEGWVNAKLDSQIRPLLMSDRVRDRGVFEPSAIEDCLNRVKDDNASNIMAMRCCALEFWFRQFVDREGFGQDTDMAAPVV